MPTAAEYVKDRPGISAMLLQVVENQLSTNQPPESKETLERLTAEGFSVEDAKLLLAQVIRLEMLNVLKENKPFNEERFLGHLQGLPQLPEEP
ncbi:hypothetical protein LPW11_06275 [Geomonas sp. RF6]|uniref:hypothetical protein n=1 Tax=Geomonas sp. RF6 TaxID=2897342 RepID=UPI001E5C055E|nr:hypothetical protein [Geomonas sp. RF6]UFS71795.1 hypothetical protein LPW11_06275 [Geomonas sp. RF6]